MLVNCICLRLFINVVIISLLNGDWKLNLWKNGSGLISVMLLVFENVIFELGFKVVISFCVGIMICYFLFIVNWKS